MRIAQLAFFIAFANLPAQLPRHQIISLQLAEKNRIVDFLTGSPVIVILTTIKVRVRVCSRRGWHRKVFNTKYIPAIG